MKAKAHVRTMRRVRVICVLVVVVAGAAACVWMARQHCTGGSSVTNPDAFASGQIAASLRTVSR